MKSSLIVLGLICLATISLAQESNDVGGGGLNVSKLPPPSQPVGEVIFRNGQVYRSQQEADAAERAFQERQQQAKRAAEQPIQPLAEQQSKAAEQRLLFGGIIGGLVAARLLWVFVLRKAAAGN